MLRLLLAFFITFCSLFSWSPSMAGESKAPETNLAGPPKTAVQQQVYSMVYSITIDKSDHKLYLYYNGNLRNWFLVGTGRKPSYTPTGTFKIVNKAKYPAYRGIPGGSPKNPLGARWLGLNKVSTNGKHYGIHGTNNPASIGKNSSAGCIRMYNQDVIFLYNLVAVGTVVTIRD